MAYVPGATYDIFISYPRENNASGLHGARWVSEFYNHLKEVLDARIPSLEKPVIFFDEKNYESGQELPSLLDKARRSAIFLAILSPAYVARGKFTLKELSEYCNTHAGAAKIVVCVDYLYVGEASRPSELQGPQRREFFRKNESGVEVPLSVTDPEYMSRIHTVAQQIKNRLDELRSKAGKVITESRKGPLKGKTVLLAQVTDDLLDAAEEVRNYIETLGAQVIPQGEYPVWGPEFFNFFKSSAASADLVVQLLSRVRSQKRDGESFSCSQFQYSVAKDMNMEIMQWRDTFVRRPGTAKRPAIDSLMR